MFDPRYWMFALPGLLLAVVATWIVKSTFARYSRVRASSGLTGAQAARRLLDSQGLFQVSIERAQGFLSDHYDPAHAVLRLSRDVHDSASLSAIGVACHEAGHALQHAKRYAPLALRTQLVPVTQIGSHLAFPIILAGLFFSAPGLVNIGILLFIGAVVFTLVTLPVEWNASARAKQLMVQAGIVLPQESAMAGAVLNAAFLTYVAAAVSAILQLLYYLSLARRR
ncbi:MAG: zinc metallopeptidase [Kiritimatiellia bacterium]|nr:zinc metallopeptidase [Kiritimatiellia bacterium]